MKKKISLVLAIILLFGMIGCSKKDKDTVSGDESTTAVTNEVTSAVTEDNVTTLPSVEDTKKFKVSTHTESFVNGECSVTLTYPRYGDGEHDHFDISMRNYVMQKYGESGMMPEDNAVYEISACNIKYESEYFVSAVIEVSIINVTAANDSRFAYTVNADPRNGRIYLSEELIGELDLIKSAFADGKFEQTLGAPGLMDEVTPDYITESWRSDYGVFPNMYFTDDSFGVVAELPRVLGGYAGFEIPYADTGDMINPVAKGLCGIIVTTDN